MPEGGFKLTFDVMGDTQVARGFSRFADNVKDMSDAFREIVKDFHEGERKQFETEGGYGAGGWQPLAMSTVLRKGGPSPILVREGTLRDSLVGESPYSIVDIRPLEARMGTKVPYARFHQKGTSRMPARPVIMLPEGQKTRWHKIVHRYLVKQADRSFR